MIAALSTDTNQLIMIGDHEQLRPKLNLHELLKYNFDISLFERLALNDINMIRLNIQMRMSPEICDLVRGSIYRYLQDDESVKNYPNVKGVVHNLYWIDHCELEEAKEGESSKFNSYEAEYIVEFCKYLVKRKNQQTGITVLTPYAAQLQEIKNRMDKFPILRQIRVTILDTFQGEENDIILLSMVRSNTGRDIGFLKTRNRISVLLSRAKFGFYIIGNMTCFLKSRIWSNIYEILKDKDLISDALEISCDSHGIKKVSNPMGFQKVCC